MRLWPIAVVVCAASAARAERAVTVELDERAPFSRADLTTALRVRLEPTGDAVHVIVATTADGVTISAHGRERAIGLTDLTGTAAARMVALVAGDLLMDDLSTAPVEPVVPVRDRMTIGVLGSGALWSDLMAGGSVDVALPRGALIATVEIGGAALADSRLSLKGATFRGGVGVRIDRIELRGGVTLAPITVGAGEGDSTILAGGYASARLRLAVSESIRFLLAAGADAFATRTDYHIDHMTVSTPWFAPWVAVGVEVTP